MQQTQVLIIGGSLVGLSASLFLAWRGVRNIVIEKHRGSSPHPRARGFTERTLEQYRAVGIADRIPQLEPGTRLRRARVECLSGTWIDETPWTPGQVEERKDALSPCTGAGIAQDKLEPILRQAAQEQGSELRLGVEMVSFRDDGNGVFARVYHLESGATEDLRAEYIIAADGADSAIREQLGIDRKGVGYLRTLRSVLFRCPEADVYLERGVQQFAIEQFGFRGFLTTYGDGRWVLMFEDDEERGVDALRESIRRALGRDMGFEIIATGRWEMAGRIAARYSQGRVFLVGDAAHQLPPTRGGFGANTGIDDTYNLAWKLELVLSGQSHPSLLETYSDERQPIGWLRHQQTFARPDYAGWINDELKGEPLYGNEAMELGQLVRSAAIVGAGPELPPAAHPNEWAGQPGTRAPHVWIKKNGETISTIDLFAHRFTLMSENSRWIDAAAEAATRLGVALNRVIVNKDVVFADMNAFGSRFGLSPEGATLVRPDGIIGWRSVGMPDDPIACLQSVLATLVFRT